MCLFLCGAEYFWLDVGVFLGEVGLCHCASAPLDNAVPMLSLMCNCKWGVKFFGQDLYKKHQEAALQNAVMEIYSGTKKQQVWTCVKSQVKQSRLSQAFHTSYTSLKTNMTLENPQFWIGNTSSHGWFSIVMLVFGWVNVLRFKVKHLQNQIRKRPDQSSSTRNLARALSISRTWFR